MFHRLVTHRHDLPRRRCRLVVAVASAAALLGLGAVPATAVTPAPASAEPSGTLIVGIDRDPERMDPNFARNTAADTVKQAIFDPLVHEDVDGTLVPALAVEYTFTDDVTLDMTLREGVVFHDGEPFTAEDVKFAIERVQDKHGEETSQIMAQFELIEDVEIVDDHHVVIHFSEPDGNILYSLSRLMMTPAGMLTDDIESNPIGTGPFKFVSYTSDNETVVEANPDYWADGPKDGPGVDSVIFRVIPEPTTRAAALTTGDVDIAMNIPLDQVELIESAGMTAQTFPDGRNRVVVINSIMHGPTADASTGDVREGFEALTDVRVRQALNYAIDRETVAEVIYQDIAIPLGQPFSPGGFGYDSNNEPYPYDPDRARELLAEAGYPDGFYVKITGDQQTPDDEIAIIIDNLTDIGLDVEYEMIDPAVANERLLAGEPGMLRYQLWNNAETFLNLMVRSEARPYTAYSNAEVDALFDEQVRTVDAERRTELINEIIALIREDPMAIYLWSSVGTIGWNDDRVTNFEHHAKGWIPVDGVEVSG
jgi:peptide/nickel transport system substrate-binding protein